jgi:3-oxoacyl-[acyl-carrier protein] reductase
MNAFPHVALVTGSGRNIGRAIILEFARRGYAVIVNTIANREAGESVAAEARALGVEALYLQADVGDADAVRALAEQALAKFGKVDVLVNNAAIRPQKPFLEMTAEEWHRVLAIDLHSAFYTAQAFLPGMVRQNWGRIVNLTGMNAIHGYQGRAPVSAAKHGLWGLTKALAKEFGAHAVTVNAISPGPIQSDHADPDRARHIQEQLGRIPLARLGEPEDIAALCGLLCSDEGGFISGQMIACNGGAQT